MTLTESSIVKLGDIIETVAAQDGKAANWVRPFNAFVRYCGQKYHKKGDPDFDYCSALMDMDVEDLSGIRGLGCKSLPILFKARKKLLADRRNKYTYVVSKWYFPDNEPCHEGNVHSTGEMALTTALSKLSSWILEHPNYEHDYDTNGIIELTSWNEDGTQDCVRIEEMEEENE